MRNIEITNGPSREELFDGLRLFAEKRLVPFLVKKNGMERYFAAIIKSIEAEDGSGHSWNLIISANSECFSEESFTDKPKKKEPAVVAIKVDFNYFKQLLEEKYPMPGLMNSLVTVKVYYSTKTRTGTLTLSE
jgi:hypothetical protein